MLPLTPSNFSNQWLNPGGASSWPERTSAVLGFQAINALALAPPADVPTRRIVCNARSRSGSWKEVAKPFFCDRISEARVTRSAIWMDPPASALGPWAGMNSRAPMPRWPV